MNLLALPPTLDCAPEFCFCGRKTIESHEFWFCSTECARLDSLRSLDNPECHYRNVVRAYFQAGGPALQPRRIVPADELRPGPPGQYPVSGAAPPSIPPNNPPHQGNSTTRDPNLAGPPTLSQVTGKVLAKKAIAGEPLVVEKHDRPRWEGFPKASLRVGPVEKPDDNAFEQISLDAIPLPEHVPTRTLRRVPASIHGLRNNTKKSMVATLLKFSKARKTKEAENPQKIFGHSVDPIVPPVRKESLPSYRHMDPQATVPVQTTKALRRSASFSGWDVPAYSTRGPSEEQDPLLDIIEEMREELSEGFGSRSCFINQEEMDY